MKHLIALVALLAAFSVNAADVTLTFTAGQLTRLQAALGAQQDYRDAQGVARPATNAELRAWLLSHPRALVIGHEQRIEAQKISVPAFDPQ